MKKTIEVVAAAIYENDKYFCAKRKGKGELAGKWEFPGGKVEENENLQDALKREIIEEFDTEITVEKHIITTEYSYKTFNIVLHVFLAKRIKGDFKLMDHSEYVWFKSEELLSLDWAAADLPAIEAIINIDKGIKI